MIVCESDLSSNGLIWYAPYVHPKAWWFDAEEYTKVWPCVTKYIPVDLDLIRRIDDDHRFLNVPGLASKQETYGTSEWTIRQFEMGPMEAARNATRIII